MKPLLFFALIIISTPYLLADPVNNAEVSLELKRTKLKPIYDYSNLSADMTYKGDLCLGHYEPTTITRSGHKIKMLGYAFVYQGPQRGTSIMGHISERIAYCRDNKFVDALYENYPLELDPLVDKESVPTEANPLSLKPSGQARNVFINKFGVEPESLTPEYLQSMTKSMLIHLDYDPMKAYAIQQVGKNRTIFEAWLKTSEEKMYQILLAAEERRRAQSELIKNEIEIPGFSVLSNNCMNNPKKNLYIINPAFTETKAKFRYTPKLLWNYVQGLKVEKIVIYPSQRMFREIIMKQSGQRTIKESIVPLSKTAKHMNVGGWMLLTVDPVVGKRNALLTPVAGLVNAAVAVVETAYGILTLPLQFIGKIFHKDRLKRKTGTYRIKMGLFDLLTSLAETAYIKVRYPMPTNDWTDEELEFAQDINQTSVMLEYLRVKNKDATLYFEQKNNVAPEVVTNY